MRTRDYAMLSILSGSLGAIGCGSADSSTASNADGNITGASSRLTSLAPACKTPPPTGGLDPDTKFFVVPPNPSAVQQVIDLAKAKEFRAAAKLGALERVPQAKWFTDGTPEEVRKAVKKTMIEAAFEHRVPVLVAYNVPFRDCAQYSAGGAVDTAAYEAWIDGFSAGIGKGQAVVILEPDALGTIPYNTGLDGTAESCKPTVTDAKGNTVPAPGADPSNRYAQLNYAVDSITSKAPKALVYLDATQSHWLTVGDAAYRLTTAGLPRAQGFFLNVSNYQFTTNSAQYGTWVSNCIAYATAVTPGDFSNCPNQYWNGGPLPAKIAQLNGEWTGVALDPRGEWSDTTDVVALNTSGINLRYANMLGTTQPTTHFVIDTSRNGQGPLKVATYAAAPYNQPGAVDQPGTVISGLANGDWCNPPGAGTGLRPTANTGVALLDAYLWVKIPGESDGSCDIAGGARAWDYSQYNPWALTGDAQNHFDPLWGIVDPAAGAWFPAQALQMAQLANPPLF